MSKAPVNVVASCAEPWLMSSSSTPKHKYDIGVEPSEYMLGVCVGLHQMSKQSCQAPPGRAGDGLAVCVAP